MAVRMAKETDMPQINKLLYQVAEIHHNERPDLFKGGCKKYTDEELKKIISDDNTPILVHADEDDIVRGYAFCIFQRHIGDNIMTDIRTLYIDDLCVEEGYRGNHIGKALYLAAVKLARENGCYNVTLNVWSKNESAMNFYRACGLQPQKVGMELIL